MTPKIPVLSATDPIGDIAGALLDHGGIIVEDFLSADQLERLCDPVELFAQGKL